MDTMKPRNPTYEGIKFVPDTAKVPDITMQNAATYEQLLSCWDILKAKIDSSFADRVKEHGTLEYWLNNVYTCFSKAPYECDSGVKYIFENNDLRQQLKKLDIPPEFLLHTVRMGAVKGMQNRLENNPTQPVALHSDGTMSRLVSEKIKTGLLPDSVAERERLIDIVSGVLHSPNIDGFSWANDQMKILAEEKKAKEKGKREEEDRKIETNKEKAIDRIQKSMREPGFHLTAEDATLLRPDFADKLVLWKAILESGVGRNLESFLHEHGDEEITTELFEEFINYPTVTNTQPRHSLPTEIINPNSGWFSVLIINKKTKLREFITSVYSNMGDWFQL